jgi:hypothetical protein
MLLFHMEAGFLQAMDEGILVNLLQVPVTMINMDGVGRLADLVADGFDVDHGRGSELGRLLGMAGKLSLGRMSLISAIFVFFAVNSF